MKHFIFIFSILFLLGSVMAHDGKNHTEIPPGLQSVIDYNQSQAEFYFANLGFLVAFLVGVIAILTPCSIAILPSFFAYTFKEKKELVKMTLMFFLGFTPVFILMGIAAAYFGKTLAIFQDQNTLVMASGFVLLAFGVMALFGKGFSGFTSFRNRKPETDSLGVFFLGLFFAVGFTACMGPALFGMLLISGVLKNYYYSAFLMFFYSLGVFVTFFIVAFFMDRFNFSEKINRLNKKIGFPITNLISGTLLIMLGFIFILYQGTDVLTHFGFGDISYRIYRMQEKLISWKYSSITGGILLLAFIIFMFLVLRKKHGKNKF